MHFSSLKAQRLEVRFWVLVAKSDTEQQSNLYELKGKLSTFLILKQTTQKDPNAATSSPSSLPAHPTPPPRLELQGIAGLQKKMSQKKELELQKATNLK